MMVDQKENKQANVAVNLIQAPNYKENTAPRIVIVGRG
jgi:hypothetical protein